MEICGAIHGKTHLYSWVIPLKSVVLQHRSSKKMCDVFLTGTTEYLVIVISYKMTYVKVKQYSDIQNYAKVV